MHELVELVRAHDAYLILGVSVLSLIVLVSNVSLSRKVARIGKQRARAAEVGCPEDVADALAEQSRQLADIQQRTAELGRELGLQGDTLARCLRNVGIIRFNAFEDVGGEQSFSLALLDDDRNGVVISSIYGRNDSRLYLKMVADGKAERAMSDEETQAIERAMTGAMIEQV